MEEFLRSLGITGDLQKSNASYVMDISNSNEYGRIYSLLDKNEEVEEDPESSQVTMDYSSVQFFNDDFTIQLIADFEHDEYRLTIKEN